MGHVPYKVVFNQSINMSIIKLDETILRQIVREELQALLPLTERFLNVQEAAVYLRCTPSTVYRLTSEKRIPFHKQSGALLFKESELLDYITNGKRSAE